MPKVKWQCGVCGELYDYEQDARECENKALRAKTLDAIRALHGNLVYSLILADSEVIDAHRYADFDEFTTSLAETFAKTLKESGEWMGPKNAPVLCESKT